METKDSSDVIYLITVLAVNGLGFFIVVICYAQIYCSLGKETKRSELTVAKKMALLVFTIFRWDLKINAKMMYFYRFFFILF